MKGNIDNSCKYLSFIACQRSVKLLQETIDTLIKALTAFKSGSFNFVDKQTDKSKDQAPKHHHYFSRMGPEEKLVASLCSPRMLNEDSDVSLILTEKRRSVQFILICFLLCSKYTEMQSTSFRKFKKLEALFTLILAVFSVVGLYSYSKSHFTNHDAMAKNLSSLNRKSD